MSSSRMLDSKRCVALLAIAACIACLPAGSQQQGTMYHVEVVVFRAATALGGSENWSAEAGAVSASVSAEPTSAAASLAQSVRPMPEAQMQLTALADKLRSTGVYVPVAHAAWSQNASPWGRRIGLPIEKLGLQAEGLSGTVSLERGQYLHLGFALAYAMPNPPAGVGAAPGTTFTLNETRRVRFYERNYYDHPAFGVIALVTPMKDARPAGR